MSIERAIEQIDTNKQEIPSNWHAGTGLSDGVTWAEVREWLSTFLALPCNCDSGEAYGHHRWCDTYRPLGMSNTDWEASRSAPQPEVICGVRVHINNPWGTSCTRVDGHLGPHMNTPIPMGMTPSEWERFLDTYQ